MDEVYTYIPVSSFENRATKKCQSLALIGNLMALLTGKEKSHLKKKLLF